MDAARRRRAVALAQGVSYVVSGAWPLAHLRSFEAVTGPKVDGWLVRSVSGILVAIGAAEIVAARRDAVTAELALVGAGTALTLGATSAVNVARRRLRRVYLVDVALEGAWLLGWAFGARTR
jgi:hypothetical protein